MQGVFEGVEFKERGSFRIIIDVWTHFARNSAYFLIYSTLPLMGLFFGTVQCLIIFDGHYGVILVAIPFYFLIHGLTALVTWERMWGGEPDFGLMTSHLGQVSVKLILTWILYWLILILWPVLLILFFFFVSRFTSNSKGTTGILYFAVAIIVILGVPIYLMTAPQTQAIGIVLFLLVMFGAIFFLSIPYITLLAATPVALLQRRGGLSALTQSIRLTWGYWFHVLPFVLVEAIAILIILVVSTSLSSYLLNVIPPFLTYWPITFLIVGVLYTIAIPFLINLRVFYFADLLLRNEGYDSLLQTRYQSKLSTPREHTSNHFKMES